MFFSTLPHVGLYQLDNQGITKVIIEIIMNIYIVHLPHILYLRYIYTNVFNFDITHFVMYGIYLQV